MATIAFDHVTKTFDDGTVAVDKLELEVAEGEFLILVGPSGCGKTTALRMVAGLEDVTEGSIRIGERDVTELAPVDRDVAMVFQNYALYPHMSVEENILFPLRQKRVPKREARARVQDVARLLAIEDLLHRLPRALSGGQRQRVAIGRALVRRPQAFLMDEPLSNLDAKLRVQMRAELLALHQQVQVTTIYVTHDQTEAMTLGDRVVVMNKGVVQQIAAPEELYREPANIFVAGFIGSPAMNLVRGRVEGSELVVGPQRIPLAGISPGTTDVIVGVRPEDFVHANGDGFDAEVSLVENLGPESLVHFKTTALEQADVPDAIASERQDESLGQLMVARFAADRHPANGERLRLKLDPARVRLFDTQTGVALRR